MIPTVAYLNFALLSLRSLKLPTATDPSLRRQELRLSRDDRAILYSTAMRFSNNSIGWIILSQPWNHCRSTRSVPPIPHQVANDREQADKLNACLSHSVVGDVANELGRCTRGLDISPDTVTLCTERQG